MDVENTIKNLIMTIANGGMHEEDITIDTILTNDFEFDSIKIIELVIEIEDQFNIILDDENLTIEKLSSYASLVEIVKEKIR